MKRAVGPLLAFLIPVVSFYVAALAAGEGICREMPLRVVGFAANAFILGYPVLVFGRFVLRAAGRRSLERPLAGRTELVAWVTCVVLVVVVIPGASGVGPSARAAKANADVRSIDRAIGFYRQHTGQAPASLAQLTTLVTNAQGQLAGPFMAALPSPPACWSPYRYERRPDGTYIITSQGENTEARAP